MRVQINNIEYTFVFGGSDHMQDEENLGLAHLILPGPMSKRFAKECGYDLDSRDKPMIPYYDENDMEQAGVSEHECYNADTQIVLMNWLFDKRRKYKLEYRGLDPFWLYHDARHALNDVYSNQINNIYSGLEFDRLLEGAEFAKAQGVLMQPETIAKLDAFWRDRWKYREGSSMTQFKVDMFYQFLTPADVDQLDWMIDCGKFTN